MIPQLDPDPAAPFPAPEDAMASPDGLLCWGGDLDPVRLTHAYCQGIFPWYSEDQPILWWSPAHRCVLFPADLYISGRLARLIRQQRYRVSADTAFREVIAGCAEPRASQDSTWITDDMIEAYCRLHRMGTAHSVEVWEDEKLVGGIYGLSIGRVFFGESMFSRARDASKVALAALCRQLKAWSYAMLDCQVSNPHLLSMGAVEIPRETFLSILHTHVHTPPPDTTFRAAFEHP
jgi:leucyl/phenylalanyl-tRNA--protein transferase